MTYAIFGLTKIMQIGDFGSARVTYPNDPGNPTDWAHDPMTVGWMPNVGIVSPDELNNH